MKILVFISKWIGEKCLNTLFSDFSGDEYLFVVSGENSDSIIKRINYAGHKYMLLDESAINFINSHDDYHYDWLLNLWGGYIFDEEIIKKSKKSLNVHPSLLPFGRGRDPVVWAIRYGHPAGVSLHQITPKLDEGPIIYQEEVEYNFPITGGNLYDLVVRRCWTIFNNHWPVIRSDKKKPISQDTINHYCETFVRKDLISDQIIDLDQDKLSRNLFTRVMAHDFGDEYCSKIKYNKKIYSIRLLVDEKI